MLAAFVTARPVLVLGGRRPVFLSVTAVWPLLGPRGAFSQWDGFLLLVESGAWGDEALEFLPLVLHDSSPLQEELGAFSLAWGDSQ